MADRNYNVLFLCTGNSARSIIAECVLNRLGHPSFKAYSAGSFPKGEVNPYALKMLEAEGYDVSALRSKSWDEFTGADAPQFDFVFTLCDAAAAEPCPVWAGRPATAHWGLPDPAAVAGRESARHAAFADALRTLTDRIRLLVSLPLAGLDRPGLQQRLNDIGASSQPDGSR